MKKTRIFVFGSNLAGIHGAGSAKCAVDYYGAEYGTGVGLVGNSYAIPTKDHKIRSMKLEDIKPYVREFLEFAETYSHKYEFDVVAIGCGLAGFTPEQIAPMFEGYSSNVHLPIEFREVLGTL